MSAERFAADWLALREPADHRARSAELAALAAEVLASEALASEELTSGRLPADRPVRVLDLGAGAGSNLRWLAPRLQLRLERPQRWTLVDHDAALLARAGGDRRVCVDLDSGALDLVTGADLVTASALLDLVSERWLLRLVDSCAAAGAVALFALSYDGIVAWGGPPDPLDAVVLEAVNEHQRSDKGLGPALGPEATQVAAAAFARCGYRVRTRPTPWRLGAADAELARQLLQGWATAAAERRPGRRDEIEGWHRRRLGTIESAGLELTVGHLDLLALPTERGSGTP